MYDRLKNPTTARAPGRKSLRALGAATLCAPLIAACGVLPESDASAPENAPTTLELAFDCDQPLGLQDASVQASKDVGRTLSVNGSGSVPGSGERWNDSATITVTETGLDVDGQQYGWESLRGDEPTAVSLSRGALKFMKALVPSDAINIHYVCPEETTP